MIFINSCCTIIFTMLFKQFIIYYCNNNAMIPNFVTFCNTLYQIHYHNQDHKQCNTKNNNEKQRIIKQCMQSYFCNKEKYVQYIAMIMYAAINIEQNNYLIHALFICVQQHLQCILLLTYHEENIQIMTV